MADTNDKISTLHVFAQWAPFTNGRFEKHVCEFVFGVFGVLDGGVLDGTMDINGNTSLQNITVEIVAPGSLRTLTDPFVLPETYTVADIYRQFIDKSPELMHKWISFFTEDDTQFTMELLRQTQLREVIQKRKSAPHKASPHHIRVVAVMKSLNPMQCQSTFSEAAGYNLCVWHPTKNWLAISKRDALHVVIWDVDNDKCIQTVKFKTKIRGDAVWDPTGCFLSAHSIHGNGVVVHDVWRDKHVRLAGKGRRWGNAGPYIWFTNKDTIEVKNFTLSKDVCKYTGHKNLFNYCDMRVAVTYHPTKHVMASCVQDTHYVHLWSAETGQRTQDDLSVERYTFDVKWCPKGDVLACIHERYVSVWDTKQHHCIFLASSSDIVKSGTCPMCSWHASGLYFMLDVGAHAVLFDVYNNTRKELVEKRGDGRYLNFGFRVWNCSGTLLCKNSQGIVDVLKIKG